MDNTCLVIGANGFIGSYFVDNLSAKGFNVIAFDRYGRKPQFAQRENIEVVKGDVFNMPNMLSVIQKSDYVFHCFSATTPFSSENDPYSDINLNLENNVRLLESCTQNDVKKFIYISSGGAIYGKSSEDKVATEDDITLPVSPYGICKLATENYLGYYQRKAGLPYLVFRMANPYGPRQLVRHNQGVVPAFLEKVAKGEEIVIYGDGSSSRDYIYITDAISMITEVFDKGCQYSTYNIGSGTQTSLATIINYIEDVAGQRVKVSYREAPKTFMSKTQISIDRYWEEFGKPDLIPFDQGIKLVINNQA